jgi:DegV family protein with EDD domain
MAIRIVTDSTSDIDAQLAIRLGVKVVPLTVFFGKESFRDRVDISTDEFYRRLSQENTFPTTTQPSPVAFAEAYRPILAAGDDILVIVISGKLSGTYQSAVNAVSMVGGEGHIYVIDSRNTAMGLGLLVIAAAEKAGEKGATLDTTAKYILEKEAHTHIIMLFDTLKYLARGGRIGKARGLLGSLLSVKPILTMKGGEVTPLTRLRSMAAGTDYLYNFAANYARIDHMAVEYATTPYEADALIKRLGGIYPRERIFRATISPVLGAYMGPNVLSVAVLAAPP